jgi:hypothetical protein
MTQKDKKQKKLRVRGTGCYDLSDNSFEFTAFNEGPSSQTNVKNCKGGGKSWETTGSDPSRMITLKTKMSSPDQYADVLTQFETLTKDLKPKKPVVLPDSQRVVSEAGLQCWLNATKNELIFSGIIDLSKHPRDWQAEVLRQVQLVVRRLPASERFNKIINNLKTGGLKK